MAERVCVVTGVIRPSGIADAVHHLVHQERSAWTFELDLRPFGESW